MKPVLRSVLAAALLAGAAQALPQPPRGLPPVPFPSGNPPTAARVALGKRLFNDSRLSQSGIMSCASCHEPARAFAGSVAASGQSVSEAPSLFNTAFLTRLMSSGKADSLEAQVRLPLYHPHEMSASPQAVLALLRDDPEYQHLWCAAFGAAPVAEEEICQAIAAYERTLLSGNSRFDRAYYGGETDAMSPLEWSGFKLFVGKAGCSRCHSVGPNFALLTDGSFHQIGTAQGTAGTLPGLAELTGLPRHEGALRTPSLREITRTAPYMHDGRFKTLEEVIDYYNRGLPAGVRLSPLLTPLQLSREECRALLAFLQTLEGGYLPTLP
jgi:cytochrome c peroxidase